MDEVSQLESFIHAPKKSSSRGRATALRIWPAVYLFAFDEV